MSSNETIFSKTAENLAIQLREAAVDHEAFELPMAICELTKCRATCCHDGVILTDEEAQTLKDLGGEEGIEKNEEGSFRTRTREARSTELADDFPKHFPQTRCVFLDEYHHCHWQSRAMAEGRPAWFYKPTSCWMHPLLLSHKEGRPFLTLVTREEDRKGFASHTPCGQISKDAQSARLSLKSELEMLTRLSGRDFFAELNAPSF